ncbi:MAG: ATP-binding protein [Candidatus Margulisiibacteriota bacterium]
MSVINAILIIALSLNVIISSVVFFKKTNSKLHISFAAVGLSLSLWGLSIFLFRELPSIEAKLFWGRMTFVAISLIPSLLHYFFLLFPAEIQKISKKQTYAIFSGGVFFCLVSFTSLIVVNASIENGVLVWEFGFMRVLYSIYIVIHLSIAFIVLIRKFLSIPKSYLSQMYLLLLGTGITAVISIISNLVLPLFGILTLNNIGPASTIFMILFIAYAILKHKFLDIEVIIKRSFIFATLVAAVSLTYTGSVIFFGEVLQRFYSHGRTGAAVLTGVLITMGFQPLKKWLTRTTDRFLFQKRYNYQRTLQHLSKTLNTTIMLERILKLLMDAFLDTIRVEKACIVFQDRKTGHFVYRWGDYQRGMNPEEEKMAVSSPLIEWFRSFRSSIDVDDMENTVSDWLSKQHRKKANGKNGQKKIIDGLKKDIAELDAQMIVPFYYMDKLTGFFALGKKMSGYDFSKMDRELLEMIAYQAGTAMENARLYAEERRRVNELTLLNTAGWSINSSVMSNSFHETILTIIKDSLKVDRVMLALLEEGDVLKIAAVNAPDIKLPEVENIRQSIDNGIWQEFFKKARPLIVPAEEFYKLGLTEDEISRLKFETEVILIPLIFHTKIQGYLAVDNKESGRHLSRLNKDLISSIASQIALALENARLNKEAIDAQKQVAHTERLAALGTMVAGFAHEIKNPMVALKTFTDILPSKYEDEKFRKRYMEIVPAEVKRVNDLVEEMLSLARTKKQLFDPVDIFEVIKEVAGLCEHQFQENDVAFVPMINKWPKIKGVYNQIKQVFLNLFSNAAQAMPKGGELIVSGDVQEGRLHIRVTDTGIGISKERIAHVFEPFYTTRHEGTGLGLAITHKLIEDHDGTISVESKINQGTTFTVTFPVSEEEKS